MSQFLHGFLRRVVREGILEVETANGRRVTFGNGRGTCISVRLARPEAERRIVLNPELAFGELYSEGQLVVTNGTLYDLVELISRNLALQPPPGIGKARTRIRNMLHRLQLGVSVERAKRNAAHHYDLNGEFYDLFLDRDRQYSCAYFEHPAQSLEDAQHAKKRHVAAKLLLEPGQKVLDVGSGWGGLALYLAEQCDVGVTGITLSEEQLAFARSWRDRRLATSSVRFDLLDYRAVSDVYDRIVSVGMFEHVGVKNYDEYFRIMASKLARDGVMLLHSIGRVDGPGVTNPWISKYIFPDGYVPSLSEVLPSIERAGLMVTDVEVLRRHYAETLRHWRHRFLKRWREAVALTDEHFCRMWEFYLTSCECGFRYGGLVVFQIQLARALETVPVTRRYIFDREDQLRRVDREVPGHALAAE